ncbi:MAG: amidohydrolase [Actinomycetia bacterium]|nr:amidohydrolase [Actinomycetes bacterium]
MAIIDAQVHTYERDRPERPWARVLHGPPEVTGDDMVAAMDAVGVDGALLVSPWTMYRFDASYACEVHQAHPDRFGLIKPVNPNADDLVETIDAWAETPGAVGIRIMMVGDVSADPDDPGLGSVLERGAAHGFPVNVLCRGRVSLVGELALRHPETQLVVDHLGLRQPFEPPVPDDPFAGLDAVVALADHENIVIKITGACTLSHEPFPYPDIWAPLHRLFDAFGIDRCLWGTDWTRAVELLDYEQGVEAFRLHDQLTDGERSALMGGSLEHIYDWSPSPNP